MTSTDRTVILGVTGVGRRVAREGGGESGVDGRGGKGSQRSEKIHVQCIKAGL